MPVALMMNVAVIRRSGKGPYRFTPTGVSAGQVSAQRIWCVWQSVQQVLYCHWKCAAGAHCRMASMELGEHVMSGSAVA